jgi:hypothetical protein
MNAATNEQKIALTSQVMQYEAVQGPTPEITLQMKISMYPALVGILQQFAPWSDEGPLWAYMTGSGWWDTWRNLRTRVDAANPAKAGRVATAEPDSVAGAALEGAGEGLKEGADKLAAVGGNIASGAATLVQNADKLLLIALVLGVVFVAVKLRS